MTVSILCFLPLCSMTEHVSDESRVPDPLRRAIGRFHDLQAVDDFHRRSLRCIPHHRLVAHDHVTALGVDPVSLFS